MNMDNINYNQWVQKYVTAGCIGRGINFKYGTGPITIGSTTSPISLDFYVK